MDNMMSNNAPMMPDHELPPHHAPMSLKIVLLLFALVVVGALSYLVLSDRGTSDDAEEAAAVVVKKKTTATSTATKTTDETADWKTYSNTVYGFSLKYPNDWKLSSSTIDSYQAPATGFTAGGTHFNLYQGASDNNTRKIEFSLLPSDSSTLDQEVKSIDNTTTYTESSRKALGTITWSLGKNYSTNDQSNASVGSYALIAKNYTGVAKKYIGLKVTGYEFTGSESSKYSSDLAVVVEKVLGTYKFD